MDKKNLITFVDLGTTGVRACSFNIETKKIESNFDLPINKEELNNLTSKDEIIEKLVFNIEKKSENKSTTTKGLTQHINNKHKTNKQQTGKEVSRNTS